MTTPGWYAQGPRGKSIHTGEGAPTLDAPDGDLYVNHADGSGRGDLYERTGGAWVHVGNVGGPKGDKGDDGDQGPPNSLSIGSVTSGAEADAEITGDSPSQTLNLVLPKGDKGDDGDQGPPGDLTESGLTSLVQDPGSDIRAALNALYEGGGEWGEIGGTLTDQTDLASALGGKQDSLGFTPENSANRGQPNGYAPLDASGHLLAAFLPASVMEYKGVWNADTNTPALADGTGNTGDMYRVGTGGTHDFGAGDIEFSTGDYVLYSGTVWERSGGTGGVSTVAGKSGDVVLDTDDIDGLASILDSLSEGRVTGYSNGTANALNFDEMNETQWAGTTPVSGRIYLVFED